ncbi:hypothetical protein HYC85_029109 [Camellia sinensis]|uniref:Retrotransposon gag domain-containing protein n=1 Tax=Camellia sinensis TaxID=4442 RepID=A0A7J7FZE2_CAMSI|nr:hypothetical protein HYC85_029109 [Camellia sinensis]
MDTIATTIAAQGTTLAAQGNTLAELQRPFGASTTQPPPVTHPVPPPPPLVDEFPELNSPEDLRLMGLTCRQKLSLFRRTLSRVAAIWYAKLEDSIKGKSSNDNQQTTSKRPNPHDSHKSTWKDVTKMIVLPLFTFNDLNEIGVQIEDAIKQGIIVEDKEPVRKSFGRSSNATSSGSTVVKPSEINLVAITTKIADPFAHAGLQNTTRAPSRTFTPLHMSLSNAMKMLTKRGYLSPLDPRPLPEPLLAKHDPTKHCAFHQQPRHDIDRCFHLRHEIQDLIDNKVITPPQPPKPNVTANPLLPHDRVPPPPHLNLIHTLSCIFNPSIYITSTHLPKPEVYIPEGTELCIMDAPPTQQKPKIPMILGMYRWDDRNQRITVMVGQVVMKLLMRKLKEKDEFRLDFGKPVECGKGKSSRGKEEKPESHSEHTVGMIQAALDNCLSVNEGEWWDDNDLQLTHTDDKWVNNMPDETWYANEIDYLTRSGRYFKPPYLDQGEPSSKDKEVEKEKEVEEDLVLKQLKKIQANISIWGLLMAS